MFTAVGGGAPAAQIAATLKTDARATELLLNALVALGLLRKTSGTFRNTPVAARFFAAARPMMRAPP